MADIINLGGVVVAETASRGASPRGIPVTNDIIGSGLSWGVRIGAGVALASDRINLGEHRPSTLIPILRINDTDITVDNDIITVDSTIITVD